MNLKTIDGASFRIKMIMCLALILAILAQ